MNALAAAAFGMLLWNPAGSATSASASRSSPWRGSSWGVPLCRRCADPEPSGEPGRGGLPDRAWRRRWPRHRSSAHLRHRPRWPACCVNPVAILLARVVVFGGALWMLLPAAWLAPVWLFPGGAAAARDQLPGPPAAAMPGGRRDDARRGADRGPMRPMLLTLACMELQTEKKAIFVPDDTVEEYTTAANARIAEAIAAAAGRDPLEVALDARIPHARLVATQVKYLARARRSSRVAAAQCILPPRAFEQASSEACAAHKLHRGRYGAGPHLRPRGRYPLFEPPLSAASWPSSATPAGAHHRRQPFAHRRCECRASSRCAPRSTSTAKGCASTGSTLIPTAVRPQGSNRCGWRPARPTSSP